MDHLPVEFLFSLGLETVSGSLCYSFDRAELERFTEERRVDLYHRLFQLYKVYFILGVLYRRLRSPHL